jgi:hypothetical protein
MPDNGLDDLDRKLILFVYSHRRAHGAGPLWSECRSAFDLPTPSASFAEFTSWWEANRADFARRQPFDEFRARHPELNSKRAQRRWRNQAYRQWKAGLQDEDPLAERLRRLKRLGYLAFTTKERSLDVGARVRARQRQKTAS